MFIDHQNEGVWVRDMPMWVVDTLLTLPEWIESDHPGVRRRLMPKAYQDEAQDQEWRDALGASLEHLVAKRTEIVRGDMQQVQITADPEVDDDELDEETFVDQTLFEVWIPAAHVSAWVSSLQAGAHAIFIIEGLTEADLSQEAAGEILPEKHISLVRLSILQEILVRLLDADD